MINLKLYGSFKKKFLESLNSDDFLAAELSAIQQYLTANTKYPYLYLGNVFFNEYNSKTNNGVKMMQKIHVFTQEKSTKKILKICDKVTIALENIAFEDQIYYRAEIFMIELNHQKDGITTEIIIKTKITIME